jgi:hypothetical protein
MPKYKHDSNEDNPFKVYKVNSPIGLQYRIQLLRTLLINNEKLSGSIEQLDLQNLIDCNSKHITAFIKYNLIKKVKMAFTKKQVKKTFHWVGPKLVHPVMVDHIIKENKANKKNKGKKK